MDADADRPDPLDPSAASGTGAEDEVVVSALAINVVVPEVELSSITVRLLPDGLLVAKAYGRTGGGRARRLHLVPGARSS